MSVARASGGVSLVELLVALALGLLLSAAMVSVFISGKANYLLDQELARMQENGRFALALLRRELAMAGFLGGTASPDTLTPAMVARDCARIPWALEVSPALQVLNDVSAGPIVTAGGVELTCLPADDLVPDADLLVIKRVAAQATLSDGRFPPRVSGPRATQWYLRSESFGAELGWHYVGASARFDSGVGAGSGVSYWAFNSGIYFIRAFSSVGDGVPSLCVERLAANGMATRCLVEGIEDMQIEFGIDANADGVADHYDDRPDDRAAAQAVVARVFLLVRSLEPVSGHRDSRRYRLGRKELEARNDAFLRRVYSTSVQLRNSAGPVS